MELFNVVFRTIFFYFFVTLCYRLMGKREIGQLGVIDLIVSILIAELVAISIEENKDPMYLTIVPILLLVVLEITLAYISIKNEKIRTLLEGKPSLIIINGKLNYHEMVKQRYTLDDLFVSLRQAGISDISKIEYAVLETNGKLSIFEFQKFKKGMYPMPLILDGIIQSDSLKYLHKDEKWLNKILINIKLEDIFYAFFRKRKIYIIKKVD